MEQWIDVKGYEGYYQISDLGRVRALERTIIDINKKPRNRSGRILRVHPGGDRYLNVRLCKNGITKNYRVHRLVAIAFLPNPDNLPVVNHLDADILNNTPSNLEWCTTADNNWHTVAMGRRNDTIGSKHHFSIITEKQAEAILLLGRAGMSRKDIAEAFGISRGIVKNVQNGNTWKHI